MNKRIRPIVFGAAGILVLAGAVLRFIQWVAAPYLFAVGSAGIAIYYLTMPVKEMDFRERRLHRFNVLAGLLMIISSGLMFQGSTDWVISLTISAIFQLYAAFVSPKKK